MPDCLSPAAAKWGTKEKNPGCVAAYLLNAEREIGVASGFLRRRGVWRRRAMMRGMEGRRRRRRRRRRALGTGCWRP